MDTPYGIFEYNLNNICSYISYLTNTSFSYVKSKKQIIYLDNYIYKYNKSKNRKVVFIYENEYVDKHYIEDYASYYVSCFATYKKTCSRIHFFQIDDEENDYKQALKDTLNGHPSFINNDNYLGYVVVRPIPKTFLAKICLKPYHTNTQEERFTQFIMLNKYSVSLFGIELGIDTIAFQEQDKILSACATTSLWSFYHAHPSMAHMTLPSSSTITKSAYPEQNGHYREFPNTGLSTDMICRSLRKYNLSPEYFEFSETNIVEDKKDKITLLQEYIHAYSSSGMPLILGIQVKENNDANSKGLHAITILGYSLQSNKNNSNLISHNLDSLYVHDDRFGPFLKIDLKDDGNFSVIINNKENIDAPIAEEVYTPDALIVGLYHKIRIPYIPIKNTCLLLMDMFKVFLADAEQQEAIDFIQSIKWDIQIKQIQILKNDILKNSSITEKEKYLTKPWPKYIWSATALIEDLPIIELLFDATDLAQGNVFLDIIPLNNHNSVDLIESLALFCNAKLEYKYKDEDHDFLMQLDNFVWGVIKSFRKKESYKETLRSLFGYLKIPKEIKEVETHNNSIVDKCIIRLNSKCDNDCNFALDEKLALGSQYIWLIDEDGFLCIGIENDNVKQGHPTLNDGMPARIGGQLKYNLDTSEWEVDCFSGRYSLEYTEEEKNKFITNVIKYKFESFFPNKTFIPIVCKER